MIFAETLQFLRNEFEGMLVGATLETQLVPETGIEPVRPLSGKRRILSPSGNSIKSKAYPQLAFRKYVNTTGLKASNGAGSIFFAEQT